jgi:hypothetical protein
MHCNVNPIFLFLFWELSGLSPNFHRHVSVSDVYIPRFGTHFREYINGNQTFILESHRPFICSVYRKKMAIKTKTSIGCSDYFTQKWNCPFKKTAIASYLFALGNVRPGADLEHYNDDEDHGDEGAEDDPYDKGHRPRHPTVVLLRSRRRRCRHFVAEDVVLVVVALDDALARRVVDGQDVPDVDLRGIVRENPGRI